jgi:hypothetical protein
MNLCINCIYFEPGMEPNKMKYSTCAYTFPGVLNPVDGSQMRQPYDYCNVARTSTNPLACGSDGKYFEARS